tara:strand:+ start:180 stop:602 length:423 start_codon:yes stop_codon:yes gene_type:complete
MEKALADELKAEFISSDIEAANQSNALDFMSEEELEGELEMLNCFETWLEAFISDFALDCSHTLIDEDDKEMVRSYWFSKGMEDTFVCINPRFQIKGFDPDIPLPLLSQVAEHLDKLQTMLTSDGEYEIKKWRTDGRQGF